MYSVYTTAGFVLGSAERGEANKIYSIYTKDFGLVCASAQAVRLEKSKLRYNLDDFTHGHFSLVRGKELWKLTGSEREGNIVSSVEARRVIARVLNLVRRLVHGEEKNLSLFSSLITMMNRAHKFSTDSKDLVSFELLSLMRVLYSLGYVGLVDGLDESIFSGEITDEMLSIISKKKGNILMYVNRAIEQTQL
ncbi:MAG: hypothetical protein COV01_00995 [Candidatus Taylorbacteria bacterium CG10_big_fil_rev_8_21_14_0_10_41_48]|uniref:DNA replication/recombination mediator RecO N-terminal domain-containing protein n=1 Tax=Candidatus Taylorbacteria bacterium CG10_big_fil_rev_8_21_14_0_10_41_48 TaxID=1975024 RepID=A0A2M8LD94_9BACT|nr:MAG: hypothetical protein COV01_00995 [Candidatus Taylorbacteria bacterium CG10_big_fil_rev_8_21_14_0_10_41_48]